MKDDPVMQAVLPQAAHLATGSAPLGTRASRPHKGRTAPQSSVDDGCPVASSRCERTWEPPPPPRNTSGCRGSHHSLTSGGAARLLPGEPAPAIQPSRQPGANGRDAGSTSHLEGHLRGQPIRVCRSALAALVLALAALGAAPATAQTLSISATANCGGTPANCGTSDNRNGDRDTTWPGLQVDEGDTVTFTATASPASGSLIVQYSLTGTAANPTDLGQLQTTGANSGNVVGIPNMQSAGFHPASGYTQNLVVPVSTDSAAETDETLVFRIDAFRDRTTSAAYPLPSPATVTVTVRGTGSAAAGGN